MYLGHGWRVPASTGAMTTSLMFPRLSLLGLTASVPMMLKAFTGELENIWGWLIVALQLHYGWEQEFSSA
jgi:hypothetical protein